MEEPKGTPQPQNGGTPDKTGTPNEITVTTLHTDKEKKEETTIPKSRFDEINSQKKSAEERAEMWKKQAEELSKENEEAKNKFESLVEELKRKDQEVWKSNALAKIKPQVAKIANEMGVSFTGESQEEYDAWASGLEQKLAPHLKESGSEPGVDGNRAGDFPTTVTEEQLAEMSPEDKLKFTSKVLPRKQE